MRKKDVFTVSREELLDGLAGDWIDFPLEYGEIIDVVEPPPGGTSFAFMFTEPELSFDRPTREVRKEFRPKIKKASKAIDELLAKYKRDEIDALQFIKCKQKAMDGLKLIPLDEDRILKLLHKIRFLFY